MNSLYASLSLILAEVILFLLVVCGALIFIKIKEQRKDKKALLALTDKIKESEEDRLNVLSIKLKETHDLDSDALTAAAKAIRDTEVEFYITMMNIYADRDSEALMELDKNIAALTASNAKLGTITAASQAAASSEAGGPALDELKSENTRLQSELTASQTINERLEKELDASKKEMRETVAEFISAFSGGRDAAEEQLAKKEQEIAAREAEQQDKATATIDEKPSTNIDEAEAPVAAEATQEETPPPAELTAVDETTETTDNDEAASTTIKQPEAEKENNPFLSIDEDAIPGNTDDQSDDTFDRAVDENDLDIDLGLKVDSTSPPSAAVAEVAATENTDTPAVDDIDALLAANTNDAPASAAEPAETKSADEDLNPDDIDALIAASENETPAEITSETEKAVVEESVDTDDIDNLLSANSGAETATPEEEFDISTDDIDAILDDIDMTSVNAAPSDKKKVEKAS
jgi:hypothetical protein